MAIYRRFRVQQKYVNGQPTEEYRLGVEIDSTDYNSLEECNRGSDCTELEYRWVDMESADDYICEGTNKYKKQMKQQKCVTEEAWTNVYPYEYKKGDLIEHDSVDCGYSPTGEYHIYGTTDGHGSINISPSKEYYSSTDIVTITALPSTDYAFSCYNYGRNLNYGSVAYSSVLSLTMSNNWYVSAVFRTAQYRVYDLTTVGGSLTISPSKEYYSSVDAVRITALPSADYAFSNYSYGSTSEYGQNTTNSTLTLTMSNDWYIRGNFLYESASGGNLYYSYYTGSESWYDWSKSTLSQDDNYGTGASIIIDYGGAVQTIPVSAFFLNSHLTSIDLPNCIYISASAFAHCSKLISVNLPNCSNISQFGFSRCSVLTSIDLPLCEYLGDGAFEDCSALQSVNLPNCSYIDGYAFHNCILLNYVNSPLCAWVGMKAFAFCSKLVSIDLPKCSWVRSTAFARCSSLISVNLPLCHHIDERAFEGCYSLASIDLPNCSFINEGAFIECRSLAFINLPNCRFIGSHVFYRCYSLQSIDLPNCTEINYGAFMSCSKLSIVHLPKVTYIGSHIFALNTHIETLYMDQITSVPSGGDPFGESFNYLKSIIIPCSLIDDFLSHSMWIKYREYFVCEDDKNEIFTATDGGGTITLNPEGGKYFSGTTVNIGYTANPGYVFSYFQYGSTPAYGSTVLNESFSLLMSQNWYVSVAFTMNASSGNLYYSYFNGAERWYEWSKSTLSQDDNIGADASIIIDYGGIVLSLPSSAFYSQSYLTSIDLSKCTYIGEEAFYSCKRLQSVNLPNCSYVGEGTFYSCSWLKSVNLSKCITIDSSAFQYCLILSSISLPNCLYIGSAAFFCCWDLSYIDLQNCSYVGSFAFGYCSKIKSISLPNCSYVGGDAFSNCESLASIDLPNCTSVGNYAFYGCSSLSSINLPLCSYVGSYTFNYCCLLTSINLPKVTYIGSYVFTSIETLYMNQITSVPSGGDPFAGGSTKLKSIFIPCSLLDSFVSHSIWSKYSSYFVCV